MYTKRLFALAALITPTLLSAGENITYKVGEMEYEGYWSPAGKKDAPLVVLLHDWDGLTDYEIKRANMLTELGYDVFAADLFGKGIRPTEVKDKKQHTGELYKNRNKMRKLVATAVSKAEYLGASLEHKVIAGYCFGGAAVLEAARAGLDSDGFVTFHGGLKTPDGQSYANTKAPVVVFHGTADAAIPMEQFSNLAIELEQSGVEHEMISYGGAPHAFTVFGSKNYRESADLASWDRFTEFLATTTAKK